jgi:hypothetical protein
MLTGAFDPGRGYASPSGFNPVTDLKATSGTKTPQNRSLKNLQDCYLSHSPGGASKTVRSQAEPAESGNERTLPRNDVFCCSILSARESSIEPENENSIALRILHPFCWVDEISRWGHRDIDAAQ